MIALMGDYNCFTDARLRLTDAAVVIKRMFRPRRQVCIVSPEARQALLDAPEAVASVELQRRS
jgi:hypothetical protein